LTEKSRQSRSSPVTPQAETKATNASRGSVRAYHHGDLRRELLDSAADLLRRQGLANFSMRKLSRAAGVSSAAPYRHFADNRALLSELASEVMERFMARVGAEIEAAGDDPLERLKAYGLALIAFAVEAPAHFELMHSAEFMEQQEPERSESGRQVIEALATGMGRAIEAGQLRGDAPETLLYAMQSVAYGVAFMALHRQLRPRDGAEANSPEHAQQVLELARAIMLLVDDGLRSEPIDSAQVGEASP